MQERSTETRGWTFFTNHAHVLFCLAEDEDVRLRDVAQRVGITERAVQRIVHDLAEAGYIRICRSGRRNHYEIQRTTRLRHAIEAHCTVGSILQPIVPSSPTPTGPSR